MSNSRLKHLGLALACLVLVASCSAIENRGVDEEATTVKSGRGTSAQGQIARNGSILDAFRNKGKADIRVNRFLWTASLDVLSFLPVETADPFTGVISTGYGRPPGGGTAYRATVLISDPALDARSLKVALQTQRGPVSASTQRAVEDAILARARQLRIDAGRY
jgi:hypothetical protein